jgi:2'-5' RNA ligase
VVAALAAAPLPRATAVVGPAAATFGRSVLHLPVAGLDALAAAVAAATAGLGGRKGDPPFRGHLTLARARARRLPHGVASLVPPLAAEFPVTRAHLVRSHLGPGGPRYERLAAVPLD